jgi:hypothetical protein
MSNPMEGAHMDKKSDPGQRDLLAEDLAKIARIRAISKERDPNFMQDIEREKAEREAARLASMPAPAEKKPVRKIPPGARAHHIYMEKTSGGNDK